jgi:hypothetical protein
MHRCEEKVHRLSPKTVVAVRHEYRRFAVIKIKRSTANIAVYNLAPFQAPIGEVWGGESFQLSLFLLAQLGVFCLELKPGLER